VLFDLDEVLVGSSERFKRCEAEAAGDRRKFWEYFPEREVYGLRQTCREVSDPQGLALEGLQDHNYHR